MYSNVLIVTTFTLAARAVAQQVQGCAPPPGLLTTTKDFVLPILPTPFTPLETIEGAIVNPDGFNYSFVGLDGPAVAQTAMPQTTYVATLPKEMFDPCGGGDIQGTVQGVGSGSGVEFTISLSGFPPGLGPFPYHIHAFAVPADGNCTETLYHLDPTNRGEYFQCDTANPSSCQAGDLSGKHGKISADPFSTSYTDAYLSTDPSSPYFFGDKSIVIHSSNTTRLTCANFEMM